MAYTYDFGILGQPIENARYDDYEPQKYHCLSVDFDAIDGFPIADVYKRQDNCFAAALFDCDPVGLIF